MIMMITMIMMMTKIMTMTMKGGGEYKRETGSQGILLREPTIASSYKHDHQTDDHDDDSKDFDDGDHQVEADLHFPAF